MSAPVLHITPSQSTLIYAHFCVSTNVQCSLLSRVHCFKYCSFFGSFTFPCLCSCSCSCSFIVPPSPSPLLTRLVKLFGLTRWELDLLSSFLGGRGRVQRGGEGRWELLRETSLGVEECQHYHCQFQDQQYGPNCHHHAKYHCHQIGH